MIWFLCLWFSSVSFIFRPSTIRFEIAILALSAICAMSALSVTHNRKIGRRALNSARTLCAYEQFWVRKFVCIRFGNNFGLFILFFGVTFVLCFSSNKKRERKLQLHFFSVFPVLNSNCENVTINWHDKKKRAKKEEEEAAKRKTLGRHYNERIVHENKFNLNEIFGWRVSFNWVGEFNFNESIFYFRSCIFFSGFVFNEIYFLWIRAWTIFARDFKIYLNRKWRIESKKKKTVNNKLNGFLFHRFSLGLSNELPLITAHWTTLDCFAVHLCVRLCLNKCVALIRQWNRNNEWSIEKVDKIEFRHIFFGVFRRRRRQQRRRVCQCICVWQNERIKTTNNYNGFNKSSIRDNNSPSNNSDVTDTGRRRTRRRHSA